MRILLICILVNLIPALSFGAISGITGTFDDGQSIIISGSSFGANSISYEWIGDNIEAGTTGASFSKTNWINGQDYSDSVYATDQAHSGSKSLKAGPYNDSSVYGGDIRFNGQEVGPDTDLYMSWWVRRNVSGTGQWKMLRISETNSIVDHGYEQVWFNWNNGNGQQLFTRTSSTDCTQASGTCDYDAEYPTSNNMWYRIDFHQHTSSTSGGDGNYTQTLYTPGGTRLSNSKSNITNWSTSGHSYPWYIFQNWVGNGVTSQTHWIDDIFIQSGTQARVELCDSSTWDARTSCDIQIPTSWSTSSIEVTVNTGAFSTAETAYLYVVDSTGAVNSTGYPVTIGETSGGGGGDTTAPTVTAFTIPATGSSLTHSITTFTASDDNAVTGYLVNESASEPSAGDAGWSGTAQTSYTFASYGSKTLYAWAKDAAGNISASVSDTTVLTESVAATATSTASGSYSIQ